MRKKYWREKVTQNNLKITHALLTWAINEYKGSKDTEFVSHLSVVTQHNLKNGYNFEFWITEVPFENY